MLDLTQVTGFEWDAGNDRKSSDKHAVSRTEAEQAFVDPLLLVAPDQKHSAIEPRFHGLGATSDGRLLLISFTLRDAGQKIRVISARNANRKERDLYESQT
jgi:uncharacterized DUF497 family protein